MQRISSSVRRGALAHGPESTWSGAAFVDPRRFRPTASRPSAPKWWALGVGLCAGFLSAAPAAGQSLRFDQPWHDLGRVKSVGNIVKRFEFVNTGAKPIEVLEIRPSCGCLRPKIADKVIDPAERGVIELGIHATSQKAGKHRFQLAVTTREDRIRTYDIGVDIDLYSDVEVAPSNLLIHVQGKAELQQTVAIADRRDSTWRIESIRSSDPRIVATFRNDGAADADRKRRINIAVAGEFPTGRHEAVIEVRTNDPEYRVFEIPVTVAREPRVSALPSQVTMPREALTQATARMLLLRDSRGGPVRVGAVRSPHPGVLAELTMSQSSRPICKLRFDRAKIDPPLLTEVRISVLEPQACELVVPVRID